MDILDKLNVSNEERKLTSVAKSKSIFKLFVNDVWQGTGTVQEIAEQIGMTHSGLLLSLSRTKRGLTKEKHYRLELLEEIRDTRVYEMWKGDEFIGTGTIKNLAKNHGYTEAYLKRRASEKMVEWYDKRNRSMRKSNPIILMLISEE